MLKRGFTGFHGTFSRIHSFKCLILNYSTSVISNDALMAEFLVKSAGFSEEEAVSIVTTSKVSHRSESIKNSKLVVDFLKNSGFDESHIRKVVSTTPCILRKKVEKTLKPKFRVFQDLGISDSDLGLFISQHPSVLHRSLKSHIVPSLEMWKRIFVSNEQLVKFLLKLNQQVVCSPFVKSYLPANLLLLQSYGLPRDKIMRFVHQRPRFLLNQTQWVENIVKRVETKLGIPPTSGMFLHGVSTLCAKSERKIESCIQEFRNCGWGEAEILKSIRRHPLCLNLSDKTLRAKLKFFMEDLGYRSDYLATHPVLLTLSTEKRIVPRNVFIQALKEKQLLKSEASPYTILCISNSSFLNRYVLPYKDELPELYEYYIRTTADSRSKL